MDPSWPLVEGSLRSIACNGAQANLHVEVNGTTKIFVIRDPAKVIRLGEGPPVELQCGKQAPRAVRVRFAPLPDAAGFAGEVKALDFP